MLSVLFFFDT